MNRQALAGTLLGLGVAGMTGAAGLHVTASTGIATTAVGEGSMSFGHDDDGRAYLRFNLEDGEQATGSLLFAAEDHHEMFPDVVVRLGTIEEAEFGTDTVKFSGGGQLHDDPVTVKVEADDNGKTGDRFAITCTDGNGEIVFEADGELFRGDIRIGQD